MQLCFMLNFLRYAKLALWNRTVTCYSGCVCVVLRILCGSDFLNDGCFMEHKGRFAPSPSGRMHIGNVYTALLSWLSIKQRGGSWLLRIEDLDRQRCKPEYTIQLLDDLHWLGLDWDEGPSGDSEPHSPYFQSNRTELYQSAFDQLKLKGLVYDCYCSRADVIAARAPHGSDGLSVYRGYCRELSENERRVLLQSKRPAQRIVVPNRKSTFLDGHYGLQHQNLFLDCGDFIIRRADGGFAYQLAVVVDDASMHITEVVRGSDLLASTHQQIFLYNELGFDIPRFYHVPLLVAKDGRRLSKRNKDLDMGALRKQFTPERLIGKIMHRCGFISEEYPLSLQEAQAVFSWEKLPCTNICITD